MEKSIIIINNNVYKKFDTKITNEKYKTRNFYTTEIIEGYSPCFKFNINDKIFLNIETMLLEERITKLNKGKKINIKKNITDILYKNEGGWETLTEDKYIITIRKEAENEYFLDFTLTEKNYEKYSIILNVYLKIKGE